MFEIINEELCSFESSKETSEKGGEYFKLSVNTSGRVVRLSEADQDYLSHIRPILKLTSPDINYYDYPMTVHTRESATGVPNVLVKANPNNDGYDSRIFVVAFPFNGIIQPIPESKLYRIYKGVLAVSDKKNIRFNNRFYKKILYLVIEPNYRLFDPEHLFHVDDIGLKLEAYAYYKKEETEVSIYEAMSVNFNETGWSAEWDINDDAPIKDMTVYKGTPLYTTFRWPKSQYRDTPIQKDMIHYHRPNQERITLGNGIRVTKKIAK